MTALSLAVLVAGIASQWENVSLVSLDRGGGVSQPLLAFLVKCKCAPSLGGSDLALHPSSATPLCFLR